MAISQEDSVSTSPSLSSFEVPPLVNEDGLNSDGEREIVIAVMGITGAGKSDLIGQITNQEVLVSDKLQSCTQHVSSFSMRYRGANCTILDSPGFNDTYRTDTDVLYEISSYLSDTYSQGLKLSGIIYLHPISSTKMEGSSLRSLRMFRKLVGADALHNVVLATTHWSEVTPEVGERREQELRTTFWRELIDSGARMTRYAGDRASGLELLDLVVDKERDEKSRRELDEVVRRMESQLLAARRQREQLERNGQRRLREQKELQSQMHIFQIAQQRQADEWEREKKEMREMMERERAALQ